MAIRWLAVLSLVLPGCEQLVGITEPGAPPDSATDAPASCVPPPSFGATARYAVNHGMALAVADLDHDGKLDVIVSTGDDLVVLTGTGGGHLGPAHAFQPAPTTSTGVLALDLDGDGLVDVVTWDASTPGPPMVTVYARDSAQPSEYLGPQSYPVDAAAGTLVRIIPARLHGTGAPFDLIAAGEQHNSVFVAGPTPGAYNPDSMIGATPAVAVTDIDGDGYDDVAMADTTGLHIAFSHATFPGTFDPPVTLPVVQATGASVGRYATTDGRRSVVVVDASSHASLYTQDAPRTFSAANATISLPAGSGGLVSAVDINDDGHDDVVGPGFAALQCGAAGTFDPQPIMFGGPGIERAHVLVDVDGNGKPDLVQLDDTGAFVEVSLQ